MSAFRARYAGFCEAGCGRPVEVGDEVVYVDDELVHVECEGWAISASRPRVLCGVCGLEKPCLCVDVDVVAPAVVCFACRLGECGDCSGMTFNERAAWVPCSCGHGGAGGLG